MFTRKPRLQLEKFAINGAKRLLQHNLPVAAIAARFAERTIWNIGRKRLPFTPA
jgi:hypothetical protein